MLSKIMHQTLPLQPLVQSTQQCTQSIDFEQTILTDKTQNFNKTTIPIKEYSNKYLRENIARPSPVSLTKKIDPQRRFNVILKKRQKIAKNCYRNYQQNDGPLMFEQHKNDNMTSKKQNNHQLQTRIKTEETPHRSTFKIAQIQNELLLQNPIFSNLLTPGKAQFKKNKPKKIDQICLFTPAQSHKISHSRGLQMFSKLYSKSNSTTFQKQNKEHRSKTLLSHSPNNFETKKIIPSQKKVIPKVKAYRRPRQSSVKTMFSAEEDFELVGWQTPLDFNR